MNEIIASKLKNISTKSGVYIMKDKDGNIIPLVLVYDKNGANWWFEEVR